MLTCVECEKQKDLICSVCECCKQCGCYCKYHEDRKPKICSCGKIISKNKKQCRKCFLNKNNGITLRKPNSKFPNIVTLK